MDKKTRKEVAKQITKDYFPGASNLQELKEGPLCSVFRLSKHPFVLKISSPERIELEGEFYRVLREYDIPGIEAKKLESRVLLLTDLTRSSKWRLAEKKDLQKKEIGKSCALWYKAFHDAGEKEIKKRPALKEKLPWEAEQIDAEKLNSAGEKLGVDKEKSWRKAEEVVDEIIRCVRPCVNTLTYNDFYFVNLAVERKDNGRITMFDFDHSGRGFRESDYRNVISSLGEEAAVEFKNLISPDPELMLFDSILSVCYSVLVASEREKIPGWVYPVLDYITSGEFSANIKKARSLLRG